MKRLAFVILCLAFAVGTARSQAPAAPAAAVGGGEGLSGLLPAGTILLVEGTDLGGAAWWKKNTALGQLAAEPEMQRFLKGLRHNLEEALTPEKGGFNPFGMVGLSRSDFQGIRVRSWGFGLVDAGFVPGKGPNLDAVLTLRFRKGADKAAGIFAHLRAAAAQFLGTQFEKQSIAGRDVWIFHAPKHDLCMTFAGDRFVATTGTPRMKAVLAALDGKGAASLHDAAPYRRAVDWLGAERHGLLVYADVPAIYQRVFGLISLFQSKEHAARLAHFWDSMGFSGISTAVFADVPAGTGFRTELGLTLSKRTGVFAFQPPGAARNVFASYVPSNALYYEAERVDLEQSLQDVQTMLQTMMPRGMARFHEGVARLDKLLGEQGGKDLLDSLGTDWALSVSEPPGGGLWPDALLFVSLKDADKAKTALDQLTARVEELAAKRQVTIDRRETGYGDTDISVLEIHRRSDEPAMIAPSWAFLKEGVVFALNPQAIKNALATAAGASQFEDMGINTASSIADNRQFQQLSKLVPGPACEVAYVNTHWLAVWAYNSIVPLLQGVEGAINAKLSPFHMRLNFEDLPPAEIVTRHIGGTMLYATSDDTGVRMGYISPFGPALLAAPVAAMGAFATFAVRVMRGRAMNRLRRDARRAVEHEDKKAGTARRDALQRQIAELQRQIETLKEEIDRLEKSQR